jgi:exodeoxyribonuclease VII large subunit
VSLFDPPPPDPPRAPPPATPPPALPEPAGPHVWSVGQILADVKAALAVAYPEVWVKGELSSFKLHPSGHMYFALKDATEDATLSCVFFKFQNRGLRFAPKDGMEVEARGSFDLYAPRGSFQLRIAELRPAGIGALLLAFEALKKKLAAEGLFDPARKRPLPAFPRAIGIVTSPTGAAVRDLVHVLRRRWPGMRIVLAPVLVQGEGAAAQIADAIARLNQLGGLDALIVGRGGGSLEDLWAFNEEPVVRAIAASAIPVVSAVGHETDTTLADFAADVRAATPSAAAELVTPRDRASVRRDVADLARRAGDTLLDRLRGAQERLALLRRTYGFRRPADLIATFAQGVDDRRARLVRALVERVRAARADARHLAARVHPGRLAERLRQAQREAGALGQRLQLARATGAAQRVQRVMAARARLSALSPRAVLARGYSLVTLENGTLVRQARQLAPGRSVTLEFAEGRAGARVESVTPEARGTESRTED